MLLSQGNRGTVPSSGAIGCRNCSYVVRHYWYRTAVTGIRELFPAESREPRAVERPSRRLLLAGRSRRVTPLA